MVSEKYFKLGIDYFNKKKYQKSIECIDMSLLHDTQNSDYFYYKANALFHLNKHKESIDVLNKAIELSPVNSYKLLYLKGRALTQLQLYDQSIGLYEKCIELEPHNPEVHI